MSAKLWLAHLLEIALIIFDSLTRWLLHGFSNIYNTM